MARPQTAEPAQRLQLERQLWNAGKRRIAGVDEAGRGPLAGPVIAAAVVLPESWIAEGRVAPELAGLNDSKQLAPAVRERLYQQLVTHPEIRFAVAAAEADEIDRWNILQATHLAMRRALQALDPAPDHALVDGRPVPNLPVPATAVVGGDTRSYSIAAASVLAKVTRDRLMMELDRRYPGYGFAMHKGYPTPKHLEALARLGPSPVHRRSFAPVQAVQLRFWP
ncbi:ribonuclease HII [Limisphaera sp. 4302-co]|uniref:ribonuclease HII n=1 Tax=Limisphaera sp. 4302-co TaxID=3400417 RepID=UPI003C22FBCF